MKGENNNGIPNQFSSFLPFLLFMLNKTDHLVVFLTIYFCVSVPFPLIYLSKYNCGMGSFFPQSTYCLSEAS